MAIDDSTDDRLAERFLRLYEVVALRVVVLVEVRRREYPSLRRHFETDDIVHEVLLEAWRSFDRFDLERAYAFGAWIHTIADRTMIDLVKRAYRYQKSSKNLPATAQVEIVEETRSITSRVVTSEICVEITDSLARLSDDDHLLFRYRVVDDLPHREIALRLDESEDTIRQRWRRLRTEIGSLTAVRGAFSRHDA